MAFFGISAKNEEQKVALRYLNNEKPFTFITGAAGTGKNIIAQAVGLHNVMEEQRFKKMIYTRLQIQMGVHLGFLTGDLEGKTEPFMLPFQDALEKMDSSSMNLVKEYLIDMSKDHKKKKVYFDPVQTMRGRSIDHSYLMTDEAQNTDTHTMKGIATRIDTGSKFVFTGNFDQIDEPKLRTPESNGLYVLLKGMYELDPEMRRFDHIHLTEVHRDPVVGLVEDIFQSADTLDNKFIELEQRGTLENLNKQYSSL